ncbi:ZinT/AdcA family metal-binding protein [Psychrobacter phenylpyruvicus]|uniref:Uncharacterized protein n=1 Tax=Psychrobacter phenylpyruvicus TaxID=29432 RepID=A0A379LJW7_9GAMM|nr:ZinT/AdcA family metal-binding protein [Psychrobacter phenylpyruvicus]SUD90385.1 Uncharacterised protein [Psychrobacter phenylpyruvicus]
MAVDIKFNYYNLRIDKKRARASEQGQQFFGNITVDDFCQWLEKYQQSNTNEFKDHGKHILQYKEGKKWIRWVKIDHDKKNNIYKMLCTFNDTEVDPRLLANISDSVLTQEIPNEYGQRTLLHLVFKPDQIDPSQANVSIQVINGFTKNYIIRLITQLIKLIKSDEGFWKDKDPMTQKEIATTPYVEVSHVTDDNIISAINNGYLRGLVFRERTADQDKFDVANHLTEEDLRLTIKVSKNDSFFQRAKKDDIFAWIKRVGKEKANNFENPATYLLIKDPQSSSEVQHEFYNDIITGFSKKAYLNWVDREPDTHEKIKKEHPTPIAQFYAKMIENF